MSGGLPGYDVEGEHVRTRVIANFRRLHGYSVSIAVVSRTSFRPTLSVAHLRDGVVLGNVEIRFGELAELESAIAAVRAQAKVQP